MKTYVLSAVLLVNIVCGASDTAKAPFTKRVPPRVTRIAAKKQQPLSRQSQKATAEKKKYPLWLKIGVGVAVVTTTVIIGGLIWNNYRCNFEFDGPWSCILATSMNAGLVLGRLGVSGDSLNNIRKKIWHSSIIGCGLAFGAQMSNHNQHVPFGTKTFYESFQSAYSRYIERHRGIKIFANKSRIS